MNDALSDMSNKNSVFNSVLESGVLRWGRAYGHGTICNKLVKFSGLSFELFPSCSPRKKISCSSGAVCEILVLVSSQRRELVVLALYIFQLVCLSSFLETSSFSSSMFWGS